MRSKQHGKRMQPLPDTPVPRRIQPLPLLPELIRFELWIDGARRTVEVPKLHADKPLPFAPVLDMGMLHGARVFVTRGDA